MSLLSQASLSAGCLLYCLDVDLPVRGRFFLMSLLSRASLSVGCLLYFLDFDLPVRGQFFNEPALPGRSFCWVFALLFGC